MFTLLDENFEYVPVQYNLSWKNQKVKQNSFVVTQEFVKKLVNFCMHSEGRVFIWDFHNLSYINDRGLSDSFITLVQHHCKVILANVEKNSALEKAVLTGICLTKGKKILASDKHNCHYIIGDDNYNGFTDLTIERIHKNYFSLLIEKSCIETEFQYLVSSGVYSNMQINLKKIFGDTTNFPYVIYLLWKQIYRDDIDGIIATSKNGVAFASILGEVLGYPVLYFNIGQMFEETYNCSPEIKENGKYIHIYDMICVGSEAKVLNALVNAQGGRIIKSVGCVCLPDLEIVKMKNRYSSMNRVWSIIGQNDLKNRYEISLYNIKEKSNGS